MGSLVLAKGLIRLLAAPATLPVKIRQSSKALPGDNQLTTKLDSQLKRELSILGKPYTLTLSPQGLNLAPKGRRKGYELAWVDLVTGDAALAVALNASLARGPKLEPRHARTSSIKPTASIAKRSARERRASGDSSSAGFPALEEQPGGSARLPVRRVPVLPLLPVLLVSVVERLFYVTDAFLDLAFDLFCRALDLLAVAARHFAELSLHFAGDVLQRYPSLDHDSWCALVDELNELRANDRPKARN